MYPLYTLPNPPIPMIKTLSKSFVAALILANEKLRHNSDGRDEPCVFVNLVFVKGNGPHLEATPVEPKSLALLLSRKVTKPRIESRVTPEIAPPIIAIVVFRLFFYFVDGRARVSIEEVIGTVSGLKPARLPSDRFNLNISTPFKMALSNAGRGEIFKLGCRASHRSCFPLFPLGTTTYSLYTGIPVLPLHSITSACTSAV
jgi:hypothetical protein